MLNVTDVQCEVHTENLLVVGVDVIIDKLNLYAEHVRQVETSERQIPNRTAEIEAGLQELVSFAEEAGLEGLQADYLYLVVVLDAFSRRGVGWAMADTTCVLSSCSQPWIWLPRSEIQRRRFTIPIRAVNTARSGLGSVAKMQACALRWDRSGTATTTRCVRVSSPRSNVNSSSGRPLQINRRPIEASSTTSKRGTTRTDATQL